MTTVMTLNCDISRTSWHMRVSKWFILLGFSCSFIRAQLVLALEFPFKRKNRWAGDEQINLNRAKEEGEVR